MIFAVLQFGVLFLAIRTLEREREDLDSFSIATAVIVPLLTAALLSWGIALTAPQWPFLPLLPPTAGTLVALLVLWRHLEIPFPRALGYTGLVILTDLGVELIYSSIW